MLVNINYSGAPGRCYTPGISVTVLGQVNRFTLLPVPFVALSTGGNGGICFVSNFREGRKKEILFTGKNNISMESSGPLIFTDETAQ